METFTELKELVDNPYFLKQKQRSLEEITKFTIDKPISKLIYQLNDLSYFFTLQSCYGHFLFNGQNDLNNFQALPVTKTISTVEYRIAYLAFCVENCSSGIKFLGLLEELTAIDPDNIQLGCPEWFWERQINSFALQIVPDRFKHKDKVTLPYEEAFRIEKTRNSLFDCLGDLLNNLTSS